MLDFEFAVTVYPVGGISTRGCGRHSSIREWAAVLGFEGLIWTRAGSQPDHAFPAPDGSSGSRQDTNGAAIELSGALAEAGG
jgi:hypothetical protein